MEQRRGWGGEETGPGDRLYTSGGGGGGIQVFRVSSVDRCALTQLTEQAVACPVKFKMLVR